MNDFARKILNVGVIALASFVLGVLGAFSEYKPTGENDGVTFFGYAAVLAIGMFIVFFVMYIKYEHRKTLKENQIYSSNERTSKLLGRYDYFLNKYPITTSIIKEKHTTKSSPFAASIIDMGNIIKELEAKQNSMIDEENQFNRIVEVHRKHKNSYSHFLKTNNIKTHWMENINFIPFEQEDINKIIEITDHEWEEINDNLQANQGDLIKPK